MSFFNGKRLPAAAFKLDSERLRTGWYSDKYFNNILRTLEGSRQDGEALIPGYRPGEAVVEMQFFTRRRPRSLAVGVDKALAILKEATGCQQDGTFVSRWEALEVEAVHDGSWLHYDGEPMEVPPALKVRGRYADFAVLETPILGILSRGTRIATNVYEVLKAARGKPVLFFPARFDAHEIQAADGYAYQIAVERYRHDFGRGPDALVSTDAQGDWWGGAGGGTVAHALIAAYLGDTAAAMLAYARFVPPEVPRIALVDFNNDCVGDSLAVAETLWDEFAHHYAAGSRSEAERYRLHGVRPDTAGSLRDESVTPLGDPKLDFGVNPRLVFNLRRALDEAPLRWRVPSGLEEVAQSYARGVKIVATGGFSAERIAQFEGLKVPVDAYGVGSSLFSNSNKEGTNNDFTADVVRAKINGGWRNVAKVGRQPNDNPQLEPVDLSLL
ncbi:MAG: nicotinate phosphoribosyltransferase [Deinococcota bacterium]|nr:nicotinate phosphoribosyltransferase [Deinococcota bacterium]